MSEKEKRILEKVGDVTPTLSEEKKEYLIYYTICVTRSQENFKIFIKHPSVQRGKRCFSHYVFPRLPRLQAGPPNTPFLPAPLSN